jgi:hypothetical protein
MTAKVKALPLEPPFLILKSKVKTIVKRKVLLLALLVVLKTKKIVKKKRVSTTTRIAKRRDLFLLPFLPLFPPASKSPKKTKKHQKLSLLLLARPLEFPNLYLNQVQ